MPSDVLSEEKRNLMHTFEKESELPTGYNLQHQT